MQQKIEYFLYQDELYIAIFVTRVKMKRHAYKSDKNVSTNQM